MFSKAAEDCRTPKPFGIDQRPLPRVRVLECGSPLPLYSRRFLALIVQRSAVALTLLMIPGWSGAQSRSSAFTNLPVVLTVEGTNVWVDRFRTKRVEAAYPKQLLEVRDQGRTGLRSQATIRLSDLSVVRLDELSRFEIQPLPEPNIDAEFSLWQGLLYLLHRDRPGAHRFRTPTATAATRGTEFTLEVEPGTGRTILTVLEGEAVLSNAVGSISILTGQQGIAALGQMPTKTAVIDTTNIIQWCLYYPAVLDVTELSLAPNEEAILSASLAAYRSGDVLRAVAVYPADRTPVSDPEKVYAAGLLLAVGQVTQAEGILDTVGPDSRRLADAVRLLIAAVKLRAPEANDTVAKYASELLALSYAQQSHYQLGPALEFARLAVEKSPQFAFAWTRVAELEFSHGRIKPALEALEKSLELAPRNAQALALKGFVLSAQNRIEEAKALFEQAMAIDGGLANAWLGHGLCRIRRGDAEGGREDLQVAATLEPQRAALRSYLGKAFSNSGDEPRAEKELGLARHLDERDPTAWLYSALLLQQENRINEAVDDLEMSQALNDNRRVYRSRLLLDQDRAVRGANLANVYRDAGMTDVSVREAGRAVNADYANYSAHLFLANSFNELRDPKQINLRYETAWFSEYLVANLLAPVGAGTLSQTVSQEEYSKLFERDRLGITSRTEYFSDGEWLQSAAQYGIYGNSSYAIEGFYHSDTGDRPNNDLQQFATVLNLKQQITPQDNVYVRANYYDSEAGDVNQYYNQGDANPGFRSRERYRPSVLAGYHHEWNPGNHTLLLAGRVENIYEVDNPLQGTLFFNRPDQPPALSSVAPLFYDQEYRSELELYTAELQQLWEVRQHTFVVGARFQAGEFETQSEQINGQLFNGRPFDAMGATNVSSQFDRESVYLYDEFQIWPKVLLIGGVTYDRVTFPENYRYAPLSDSETTRDQVSPKAGLIFTPTANTTVRGAYYRALGGVSLDQSFRLEPSQVAGFNQAYRSLIPESVAGANAAPEFETWAASLEQKLGHGTFLGLSGEILRSEVDRKVGVAELAVRPGDTAATLFAAQTRERLDFQERSLLVTVNQLLGNEWSLGVRYRLSHVELEDEFLDIREGTGLAGGLERQRDLSALLHQLHLFAVFNHPSGFFARAGSIWTSQDNDGYNPELDGDDFWQFNVEAGWRFFRRRMEVRVGVLNITDQDYRLNPLNLTTELPRERTFVASLRFNF
jgi:tetratricopeptide (TPR) repeat protein